MLPHERAREKWLSSLGLYFDPFRHLDAGVDPHLFDYFVDHRDALRALWSDHSTFILAPAGGGKTALRLYLTRACWLSPEAERPFPLPYEIPRYFPWDEEPSRQNTLEALLQAGVSTLFTMMALRPYLWGEIPLSEQPGVAALFHYDLPMSLDYYLDQLEEAGSPSPLLKAFGPALALPNPTPQAALRDFCRSLRAIPVPAAQGAAEERWHVFSNVVLGLLRFGSLYILVDGLDFTGETQIDPLKAFRFLETLLEQLPALDGGKTFVKAFLPLEHRDFLREALFQTPARSLELEWDEEGLREILRLRLLAASKGDVESLEAISSPPLRDLDSLILQACPHPLPRELIFLVSRLFDLHLRRKGPTGLIDSQDWEALLRSLHT